jgi:trehalose-6-phosphate synthase
LEMEVSEIRDRMLRMRRSVRDHNIYWWAGTLIGELCELRLSGNGISRGFPSS